MTKETISLTLDVRAEDHIFFDIQNPSSGKSLKEMGIQSFASVKGKDFIPNYRKLIDLPQDSCINLFNIMKGMSSSQHRIMSVIFNNAAMLGAHDLAFGQPMYINMSSPRIDYIECYYKAIVIGTEGVYDDAMIYITGSLCNSKTPIYMSIPRDSMITEEEYIAKKKELKEEKKARVPSRLKKDHMFWTSKKSHQPSSKSDEVNVQTIDDIPSEWFDSRWVKGLVEEVDDGTKTKKKKDDKKEGKKKREVKKDFSIKIRKPLKLKTKIKKAKNKSAGFVVQ